MADDKRPESELTEQELVERAQAAVSQCNWEVGLCAVNWTRRYAKGRTDADFAALVGLTADQIQQRRRVAEVFYETHTDYPALKWSHFYAALNWDDAAECLKWAQENQATVAEMKAWRRAMHGEDLSAEPAADASGDPTILHIDGSPAVVRDPGGSISLGDNGQRGQDAADRPETLPAASRDVGDDGNYAPFRSGAASPAPSNDAQESGTATLEQRPSALRIIKRATTSLKRVNGMLTPDVLEEVPDLPTEVRDEFTALVAELSAKAAGLLD